MTSLGSSDVLFVGFGQSAAGWYRTGLPALNLGCDWIARKGPYTTASLTRTGRAADNWFDYKIVVWQQPHSRQHFDQIRQLQKQGVIVLYEIDDYIHGVRKVSGHLAAKRYDKKLIADHELCMRTCDGLIVSTPFLAERYRKFNSNIWVCRNALDVDRYVPHRPPPRETIHIGWAGATGHDAAVRPWLLSVIRLMHEFDEIVFVSIGAEYAELVERAHPGRALAIPTVQIENYPAALCNFDIALAPAGRNDFFRAKSDLRWLEASVVGLPSVVDPFVYSEAQDGRTALHAHDADDAFSAMMQLVVNPALRKQLGNQALEHVVRHRNMVNEASQWERAFVEVYDRAQAQPSSA